MGKKILLVEQHRNRAFDSNLIIGAYLKKFGHQVCFSFTGSQLCKNIADFKPDLVYYPWVTDYVYNILKKRNSEVPIINSFQEQNVVIDNFDNEMIDNLDLSDYIFTWGKRIKEKLEQRNIKSKISVVGAPRYDLYLNKRLQQELIPNKKDLATKFNLPLNKKWCLIAMDFPILFDSKERLEELYDMGVICKGYFEATQKAYWKLSKWLRKYLKKYNDMLFIIRPHPGSNLEQIKKDQAIEQFNNVRYIYEGTIDKWIINSDKYVTRFSTSVMEAWMSNKETLLVLKNLLPKKYKNYQHIKEAELIANNYKKFESFLINDNNKKENHSQFLKNYFHKLDGKASYRTAKKIDEIANKLEINEDYTSYFLEDNIEKIKANIKILVNETGLNKYNPFERPNKEYIASKKLTSRLKKIEKLIQSGVDLYE